MVWAFLFSGALNLLYFAPSLFMMQVYDRVLPTRGLTTLLALAGVALGAVLAIGVLDWARNRVLVFSARLVDVEFAPLVARARLRREQDDTDLHAPRALDGVLQALTSPFLPALLDLPWTPLFLAATFLVHPMIFALVATGIVLAFLASVAQGLFRLSSPVQTALVVQEQEWAGSGAIRALGMREAMVARYERAKSLSRQTWDYAGWQPAALSSVSRGIRIGLQMAVLAVGALLAIDKQISPGALIAASIMSSRALSPVEQVAAGFMSLAKGWTGLRVLRKLRRVDQDRPPRTQVPAPTGVLEFDHASVSAFKGGPVLLSDVCLRLNPGEIVGLIGASGSGKSSLARIAVGAAEPSEGRVRMDGADLRRWNDTWLGRHIGYLPQEIALFSGTIAQNISRFEEVEPREQSAWVVEAAKTAGAHEMIQRLPDGYDTVLGPMGRGLSSGQSQRIALARALYRRPSLLVLDEPNAHLDTAGEQALINALRSARERGASAMVIAHRAGVMSLVDRVYLVTGRQVQEVRKEDVLLRQTARVQTLRND